MADLDPSLLFAGNAPLQQIGASNDPARLAQSQQEQFKAMDMQRKMRAQNALRQLFQQPGATTPDGMVSPNALAAVMKIDPQTGLSLAKGNQDAQLQKYQIQVEQYVAKLKETEVGAAKAGFIADASADGIEAYDAAIKAGRNPQDAIGLATRARNEALARNGGQLSEQEEAQFLARPFDPGRAKIEAGHSERYVSAQKEARTEGREDARLALEGKSEAFREKAESERIAIERKREAFEERKPMVIGAESGLYDPRTGRVTTPGQGSDQYTGGLTPRARNGGDNSDLVVDNKIAFIAKSLGVDPDTPLTPGQLRAFRDAYVKTEGAKGNNVGNLKNVGGKGFQQFGSREAGTQAIDAQIKRDFSRGQTSIRSLIEGTPSGGGGGAESEMAKGIASYRIAPLSGFALRSARGQRIMAEVMKENPNYDQTQYDEKKKFQVGMGSSTPGTPGGITRTLNVAISHLGVLAGAAGALQTKNFQQYNAIKNRIAQEFGYNAPTNFEALKGIVAREIVKAVAGAGGTMTEQQDIARTINAKGSPDQLFGAIQEYKNLLAGQLEGMRQQYQQATGRDDYDRYLSGDTLKQIGRTQGSKPSVSNW